MDRLKDRDILDAHVGSFCSFPWRDDVKVMSVPG